MAQLMLLCQDGSSRGGMQCRAIPFVTSGVVAQADELVQDLREALQEALHACVRV